MAIKLQSSVQSQSIWLKVNTDRQEVLGRTVICFEKCHPLNSISLHCKGIDLLSVLVEGEQASYSLNESTRPLKDKHGNSTSLERDPCEFYKSVRASNLSSDLTITIPGDQIEREESNEQTITVEISYTVSLKHSCGLLSRQGYIITRDTVGRASGWVPCLDAAQTLVNEFELHIVVPQDTVAVSSGVLQSVKKMSQLPGWKTYHYKMPSPCAPSDVAFAIGRMHLESASIISSSESSDTCILNQFMPVPRESNNEDYVVSFNRLILEFYADSLGVLPTPTANVVFLPDDIMSGPFLSGIGFLGISMRDIPSKTCIEGSQDLRSRLAFAFAEQWFGYHVRPVGFNDLWIVRGLQHWLSDQFLQSYVGKTEYIYRRWERHNAIAKMDNGEAPPLAFHGWKADGCPWGVFFGTERSDPSDFFGKKSAVVLAMIENRAGDQLFKKQVETIVRSGATGAALEGGPASLQVSLVNSRDFLMDLSKAGDFRAEVNPFMERWVFGSGAPIVSLGVQYQKRGCMLDVGLKQLGCTASFESALSAEMEARKEKVGISGIIKVSVQEGSGVRVDHPLHLGTKGYLAQTVKVNPEVKKIAGKRGRKKKSEEALVDAKKAALQNAQHPVQYVRLDPMNEFLCLKHVHQPIRMVVNKLKNSRQIDAQAEAVRELLKAAHVATAPLQTLAESLEDSSMHWTIRCDIATALGQISNEENGCVGAEVLMSYYKRRFWDSSEDTPVRIQFSNLEEYWVTQAVVSALGRCKSSSGYTDFEIISFILECIDRFWSQEMPIDSSNLLATFVIALGNLRCDQNEEQLVVFLHEKVFEKLIWIMKMDMSVKEGNYAVGKACLSSLASMSCTGSCPSHIVQQVGQQLYRYCNAIGLPQCLLEASYKACVRFKAAWQGLESSICWCLELLNQSENLGLRFVRHIWMELVRCAFPCRISPNVIQNLEKMIIDPQIDVEIKHLVFVVSAIVSNTSIYISETFADAKPSLIKLNAATNVAQQKETSPSSKNASPKALKIPLDTGTSNKDEVAPKKLKLKLKPVT